MKQRYNNNQHNEDDSHNSDDDESDREIMKLIRKRDILKIYSKSVFINLWVLLKWLFKFIKNEILYNTRKIVEIDAPTYPNKPPSCLMDNRLGRHSYVKLKNSKIHYVEAGRENSNVILLLHGFPDCWISWRYQITELSQYYRVIAVDLKGFNDSDKPTWRPEYKPKVICDELEQFIQALGVISVIIIGHDLGGLIGWTFANFYPKSVEKLIAVSAPHPNLSWNNLPVNSVLNQTWFDFVQLPQIPETELRKTGEKFLAKFYTHLARERLNCVDLPETSTTDIWDAYKYVFSQNSDWNGPLNYYRNFLFYRIDRKTPLQCPCLVVTGNEDTFFKLESMVKSADYCENFNIKIIQDAGHFPHQQNSAEFNRIVLTYLVGKRLRRESNSDSDGSRSSTKSLMDRTFGAVTNGVKFGGKGIETVTNLTNKLMKKTIF